MLLWSIFKAVLCWSMWRCFKFLPASGFSWSRSDKSKAALVSGWRTAGGHKKSKTNNFASSSRPFRESYVNYVSSIQKGKVAASLNQQGESSLVTDTTSSDNSSSLSNNGNVNGVTSANSSASPSKVSSESAAAAEHALAINPESIDIIPVQITPDEEVAHPELSGNFFVKYGMAPFVDMFRGSAMYIARHRNTVMVFHIAAELLEWKGFSDLMNDIALTWLLGTKVVVVIGCRCFVDQRLIETGAWPPERHAGVRVTDLETLRVVKEEAGYVRFEVERQLARALRSGMYSMGVDDSMFPNVVSGNFFSAKPFGIVDGVDHQYTGLLRKVEVEKIRQAHSVNDIVLLTNLGASPSGEIFNVNSESLASGVAGSLKASKIIFFSLAASELRNIETDKIIQGLKYSDAEKLLNYNGVSIRRGGYAVIESDTDQHPSIIEFLLKMGWSLLALRSGVKRAHIIPPRNGALLQELYTRDGSGTLISRDLYEGIRSANVNDVAGLFELIHPLVLAGTLVERTKSMLEEDISSYYVYTRDGLIVACAQLHCYEDSNKEEAFAEIGCLVVSKEYRSQGRGDAMLGMYFLFILVVFP